MQLCTVQYNKWFDEGMSVLHFVSQQLSFLESQKECEINNYPVVVPYLICN